MFMQPGGKMLHSGTLLKQSPMDQKNLAIFFLKTYYSTSTERWLFICKKFTLILKSNIKKY